MSRLGRKLQMLSLHACMLDLKRRMRDHFVGNNNQQQVQDNGL
jgi:hypothetical protein